MTFLKAIAHIEGFDAPDPMVRPRRNHNPLDMEFHAWQAAYGGKLEVIPLGYHSTPRFAAFPDDASGFAAGLDLLSGGPHSGSSYPRLTIEECVYKFAPPGENNTADYLLWVIRSVGCKSTDLVKDVLALNP